MLTGGADGAENHRRSRWARGEQSSGLVPHRRQWQPDAATQAIGVIAAACDPSVSSATSALGDNALTGIIDYTSVGGLCGRWSAAVALSA